MATPDQLQSNALSIANSAISEMRIFVNDLAAASAQGLNSLNNWTVPEVRTMGFYSPWLIAPGFSFDIADIAAAVTPEAPALTGITPLVYDAAPELTISMPVLNIPSAPSTALPLAPTDAPAFNPPVLPQMPDTVFPTPPVFTPLTLPEIPNPAMPAFTLVLPNDDGLLDISERFSWSEAYYSSELNSLVKEKLTADLRNGGYGIETGDEERLWERERERELRAANQAIEAALKVQAARGYDMPPGALPELMARVETEALEKINTASREVAIKRADMYVANRRATFQDSIALENMLITYHGAFAERALNAARAAVDSGVAIYNARLARHAWRLQRYQAGAQAYEALIRGALATLETYKVRVEGVRLEQDTQRLYAQLYQSQLEAVKAKIDIYSTNVQAARVVADIERIKLDVFKLQVETFATRVQAKAQEFNMFESQIKGETAKLESYKTGVQAYTAQVDAYRSKLAGRELTLRSEIASNEIRLTQYRDQLRKYEIDLGRSTKQTEFDMQGYGFLLERHRITSMAALEANREAVGISQANAQIAMSNANAVVQFATAQAANMVALSNSSIAAASAGANVLGSVASAGLSAATGLTASITTA